MSKLESNTASTPSGSAVAPHPGVDSMPRWAVGELPPAPVFQWKHLFAFLGPGLLMGGSAIGGGEWLTGPIVTNKYGGNLLWLATMSILCQVIYNIEISRYTLYSGEPIFTGKFRLLPGPTFWLCTYILLDLGTAFPYLAASCATPILSLWLGEIPDPANNPAQMAMLKYTAIGVFLLCLVPLIVGGKIYSSLKVVMTVKIVTVLGFLLFLAIFYSHPETWIEIGTGFLKFGNVPVNKDTGECQNLFVALATGKPLPVIDLSMMAFLSALVAISGNGGLSNTPISNYTRDQGWGMGKHVGAIPSLIGGHHIELSHAGTVFLVTPESLVRWKAWYRHVMRDQLGLWMPACFFGLALPSMLSVEFLARNSVGDNKWVAAGMTAGGVRDRVGGQFGEFCFYMVLFCGFLVLFPTCCSTIDGFVRRWVDALWTSSKRLQHLDPGAIRYVYFGVLMFYSVIALAMLAFVPEPTLLLNIAGNIYNVAFGVSCWHVVAINTRLLPRELRPNYFVRTALILAGLFFWMIAGFSSVKLYRDISAALSKPTPAVTAPATTTPTAPATGAPASQPASR
jgi:hypothetical protein